jgi:hypothetical protein
MSELSGITMDVVATNHSEKVKSGVWKWKHSTSANRTKEGKRGIPAALTVSKPIDDISMSYRDFLPRSTHNPALGPSRAGGEIRKTIKERHACCQWTHQEAEGLQQICNNPWISETQPVCFFHVKHCMVCPEKSRKSKIHLPNADGLCELHHVERYHRVPPELRQGIPGVVQQSAYRLSQTARVMNGLRERPKTDPRTVVASTSSAEVEAALRTAMFMSTKNREKRRMEERARKKAVRNQNKAVPTCSWMGTNAEGWRFVCKNPCTTQKATGAMLPTCAWHLKHCRIDDPWIPRCDRIDRPNHFGVCRNHHLSITSVRT